MGTGCVVFDLDGTLADTSRDLIGAANGAFEALGHGPLLDPFADASTAFRGGRAMLSLGFSRIGVVDPDLVEANFPVLIEKYAANLDEHTVFYPGTLEAVEALRTAGYKTAICTNKPEAQAVELIRLMGATDYFDALVGADTLPVRKPDPAPYRKAVEDAGGVVARSMLIGDTVTDRDTARAAGVPVALVTFGPDGHGVADLEPDVLLHAYADLPALVTETLGAARFGAAR
jgi:phosphoglycolate phosphatase